jgi:hypothetical protein
MFILALSIVAKIWNQPRCSPKNEWIKKMCCIYTLEFHSAIKKDGVMLFAEKWMELEIIMLNEISQSHEDKYYAFSHLWKLRENRIKRKKQGHDSKSRVLGI